jgi:hypothetical protein
MDYYLNCNGFLDIFCRGKKKANEANIKFRKYALCIKKQPMNLTGLLVDCKWKIIINEEIETDEL